MAVLLLFMISTSYFYGLSYKRTAPSCECYNPDHLLQMFYEPGSKYEQTLFRIYFCLFFFFWIYFSYLTNNGSFLLLQNINSSILLAF